MNLCWLLLLVAAGSPDLLHAQRGRMLSRREIARILPDSAHRQEIFRVNGQRTEPIPDTSSTVRLRPDQFLVVRTGTQVTRITPRADTLSTGPRGGAEEAEYSKLPFVLVGTDPAGQRVIALRPIVQDRSLRYDPQTGRFRGTLLLGLLDSLNSGLRQNLDFGVNF